MKVSIEWLRQLVDTTASVDEIAASLTMSGLEVEELLPVASEFSGVVVGEVVEVVPHANASKLRVCMVNVGVPDLLQVVCGAPNVERGMRAPCAMIGARLTGGEIARTQLRGVDSNGMLCSAKELGMSEDHSGLLRLPDDAPIGTDIRDYLGLDDVILTLKVTPNRGDCLSMLGIARDLAAVLDCRFIPPPVAAVASSVEKSRAVAIEDPEGCGAYMGRAVLGLNTAAVTPEWMRRRLERAGLRTISPLVDITNYVMLERGQPMHAFDMDALSGTICVRKARAGESLVLLNGDTVDLKEDMLVIADGSGPVALAGVMGGLSTMCSKATSSVFLESAYFSPSRIQGMARRLNLNSEAAHHFERGVDPGGASAALERATELILQICANAETRVGSVSSALGRMPERAAIWLRPERVSELTGLPVAPTQILEYLRRLDCEVSELDDGFKVVPPGHRFDLIIEEDLVEEVARLTGYENVPTRPPVSTIGMVAIPESWQTRSAVARKAAGLGYQEVICYSFVPEQWELELAGNSRPVRVANPISSQMSVMRSSLLAGLVTTLAQNLNHGERRVKLFEIGRCFLSDEASVAAQPERLAGLAYGPRFPEQWAEGGLRGAQTDFFLVKGDVEALMAEPVEFRPLLHAALHPGKAAEIVRNGMPIGIVGELHPQWQSKFGLADTVVVFEVDLDAVRQRPIIRYRAFARHPQVRRDVALFVDDQCPVGRLKQLVNTANFPQVVEFEVFDVFRGSALPPGKKSVALRVVMQDTARTLTDSEADQILQNIVKVVCDDTGATLRK